MRRRLMRLIRVRHDPRYPLVLVGLMGIGAYVLFIVRFFWG